MRATFLLLALTGLGCSSTEPRPFGLEKSSVTLGAAEAEMVGFRVAWRGDAGRPVVTVTPDTGLLAELTSAVSEDDAVAGGVTVRTSLLTVPGTYRVTLGEQKLEVVVSSPPVVTNDARTTRRSTVAQLDRGPVLSTMAVLHEDGTVWQLVADGGVERLELLSGVTAISAYGYGAEPVVAVTLDGPGVDVRATQSESEVLEADGTVHVESTAVTDVAAIRPYFIAAAVQQTFRVFLKKDGTVSGPSTEAISAAIDVIPLGNTFLRAGGVVLETVGTAFEPVFASPGLRDFEGAAFETYSGQTAEYRHHSLWRTADGVAWGMPSERSPPEAQAPRVLAPPAGVTVKDVFARGRGWYLLGADGRLYDATGGQVRPTPLPFLNVRAAAALPDVGVFSDGIAFRPGETVSVPLRVRRAGFEGALTLTPRALPPDVTVSPVSIAAGATSAVLSVSFAATGLVRPMELELALTGEGLARTTLLSIELPRSPRRTTVARDLVLKSDGTVWRFSPGPPVQLPGLSNIISITDNMALDVAGAVFSFGDNSEGQLGRVTAGPSDATPALIPGIPPMVAIARCTAANNLSMLLDGSGGVWRFGRAGTFGGFGSAVPMLMTGLPKMVDVNGDGSPVAMDESGAVWLLNRSKNLGGAAARIGLVLDGMPAAADQNHSIPPTGRMSRTAKVLWFNGFATLTNNTVTQLALGGGLGAGPPLQNSQGAVYSTQEGVMVKRDGTLWKLDVNTRVFQQVSGVDSVAMPR